MKSRNVGIPCIIKHFSYLFQKYETKLIKAKVLSKTIILSASLMIEVKDI